MDAIDSLMSEFFSIPLDMNSEEYKARKLAFKDFLIRGFTEACHIRDLCPLCGNKVQIKRGAKHLRYPHQKLPYKLSCTECEYTANEWY